MNINDSNKISKFLIEVLNSKYLEISNNNVMKIRSVQIPNDLNKIISNNPKNADYFLETFIPLYINIEIYKHKNISEINHDKSENLYQEIKNYELNKSKKDLKIDEILIKTTYLVNLMLEIIEYFISESNNTNILITHEIENTKLFEPDVNIEKEYVKYIYVTFIDALNDVETEFKYSKANFTRSFIICDGFLYGKLANYKYNIELYALKQIKTFLQSVLKVNIEIKMVYFILCKFLCAICIFNFAECTEFSKNQYKLKEEGAFLLELLCEYEIFVYLEKNYEKQKI